MAQPKTYKTPNGLHYKFDGELSSVIDQVFIEHFFSQKANQGTPQLIVPDGTVELIFTQKKFERRIPGQKQSKILKSHISGLKTSKQDIILEGSPLISIRFKPEKIYQLTGIPAYEFINQAISPEDIFGATFDVFHDQLFNQNSNSDRLSIIEKYFSQRLKQRDLNDDKLVNAAKERIEMSNGSVQIKKLCADFGISQKTMENKFKWHIGITPKQYCRLMRFISSVQKYHSTETNLTSLAYEQSFSDQSHLIKDFIRYTGLSPKEYFSQPKGIQEDIF